ncbi:3-oxoacyl-ACP synthase III [Planctomycetales bacterium]|nr:3-oxoacyl-ACP synthase III [Planctomycetales bacterium]GHS98552.1 3-oxoacyl-ACP synthase III [Planctomycetales bacterium]
MLFHNAALLAVAAEIPPRVVASAAIENELAPVYERLKLPAGRLELMSGIRERRFWHDGMRPSRAAALAGEKALAAAGLPREKIGCLINASVCRDFMEPATASLAHHLLGLSARCQIFDLSNACLGVLNAVCQLAAMLDLGIIDAGLIVAGEVAEPLHRATIKKLLADKTLTRQSIKNHFASLTIGSGAVGVVVANRQKFGGHQILGGAGLTNSAANKLCREDTAEISAAGPLMATDSEKLLCAGCELAAETWRLAAAELGWTNDTPDRFFTHQVGSAHSKLLFESLGLDAAKDFPTYPRYGNTGAAALPTALATAMTEKPFAAGEKIALLGIGSGLSSMMIGAEMSDN